MVDLVGQVLGSNNEYVLLPRKQFYIAIMFVLLILNILKKNLKELSFTSYLIIAGFMILLGSFIVKYNQIDAFQVTLLEAHPQYLNEITMETIVDSTNIVLASYGFILNFLPVFR